MKISEKKQLLFCAFCSAVLMTSIAVPEKALAQTELWQTDVLYSNATDCGSAGLNCSGYTNKQASQNDGHDKLPQMNNFGDVVWQGRPAGASSNEYEIYYRQSDTGVTEQITTNLYPDERPRINDAGDITWMGFNGTDWEVYLRTNEITSLISTSPRDDRYPKINSLGDVAWIGKDLINLYEIYLHAGGVTTQIETPNSSNDIQVRINDSGDLMWRGWSGLSYDIYTRRSGSIIEVTSDDKTEWGPQINNNGDMVWSIVDGGQCDIVVQRNGDLNPTQIITDVNSDDELPMINQSGDIVWQGYDGNDWEIFTYSGGVVTQITNNSYHDASPHINDSGDITWLATNGDIGIYLYQAASQTISKLSDTYGGHYDADPDINNAGQVVWSGFDGNDFEVIVASPPGGIHDDVYFRPRSLNLRSQSNDFTAFVNFIGVEPEISVDQIDTNCPITISQINDEPIVPISPLPTASYEIVDFDEDGVLDLTVQYDRQEIIAVLEGLIASESLVALDSVKLRLDGELKNDDSSPSQCQKVNTFYGEEVIKVIDKKMSKPKKVKVALRQLGRDKVKTNNGKKK